jgi:hypothetical protein
MYNLLVFINIATCFDQKFGHHQALSEHCQVIRHIGLDFEPVKQSFWWSIFVPLDEKMMLSVVSPFYCPSESFRYHVSVNVYFTFYLFVPKYTFLL